ncbi:MAG: hypothetical protein LKG20_10405 [Tetrasphaera jenkinsii]|jgi:hypothetical protein|nr:hypothetical protein [Tetrasphaera jenkinsii]
MTNRFGALTVIAAAGLALTGCGGSSDSPSSSSAAATSNSAPAPASSSTSAATSASSSATESGGGSAMGDPEKCLAAASAGLDMTSVGLDALTGDFDQAAFDKAFPASTLEKVPDELKDAYQAAMDAAKALVGKSAEEAMTLSNAYTDKMTDYANQLGKVCAGQ